jgi:hypothetical protein
VFSLYLILRLKTWFVQFQIENQCFFVQGSAAMYELAATLKLPNTKTSNEQMEKHQ